MIFNIHPEFPISTLIVAPGIVPEKAPGEVVSQKAFDCACNEFCSEQRIGEMASRLTF
jgi:hypothetical protein